MSALMFLVSKLSLDEFAVETSDVSDSLALRTYSLASTCVCTVTETEFVHLSNHRLSALSSLWASLWKKCQLAYL